jgi:polyisoprenoid-binding protein YceI
MNVMTNAVPTGTWSVDPIHSAVSFEVQHMGLSIFSARFTEFDIQLAEANGAQALQGTVQVDSLDILDETMRAHVLAPDFLDAERYPELRFGSSALTLSDDSDELRVEGTLSIRGVERQVTATGTISPAVTDPFGNQRIGIALVVIIDRTEFGLNFQQPMPDGSPAIANEVTLIAALELVRAG